MSSFSRKFRYTKLGKLSVLIMSLFPLAYVLAIGISPTNLGVMYNYKILLIVTLAFILCCVLYVFLKKEKLQ